MWSLERAPSRTECVPEERLLPAGEPLHPGPDVDGPEPALPRHLQARLRVQPRRRVGAFRQAGEVVRVRVPAFPMFRSIRGWKNADRLPRCARAAGERKNIAIDHSPQTPVLVHRRRRDEDDDHRRPPLLEKTEQEHELS